MILFLGVVVAYFLVRGGQAVSESINEVDDTWHKYDPMFIVHGKANGVDWKLLKAIALNESSLGQAKSVKHGLEKPSDIEGSKSSDGKSWGLMQMTVPTARDFDPSASAEKLNNPNYSVMLAARFFKQLQNKFSRLSPRWEEYVVKSYNQGAGNTNKEIRTGIGYADEYWLRYQRNLERVKNEN